MTILGDDKGDEDEQENWSDLSAHCQFVQSLGWGWAIQSEFGGDPTESRSGNIKLWLLELAKVVLTNMVYEANIFYM